MLPRKYFRLVVIALTDEPAELGKVLVGTLAIRVQIRVARPDGHIVELKAIVHWLAEDHRTQAAVADWKRLDPLLGRSTVPKHIWILVCEGWNACQVSYHHDHSYRG